METILLVDGDPGYRKQLEAILTADGYAVETAPGPREAVALGCRRGYDLLLSDMGLPDGSGQAVLRWFAERAPETPAIVFVAQGSTSQAMEALKLGAADYLGRPLTNHEALRVLVRRTLENRRAGREREFLREEAGQLFGGNSLVAQDPGMLELIGAARRAAGGSSTVLLTGEHGTGKEALARFIHANSPRAGRAFVAVRCGSAAPPALAAVLFGAEAGAPGGAVQQKIGRLEQAHQGTLYLEGVGNLESQLQSCLLRFLERRSFERVGGAREFRVDARLIASSTRDLGGLVAAGRFSGELHRRLAEITLGVPPLRERRGDIPVLARCFLARAAAALEKTDVALTPAAERALLRRDWPGNARELRNTMECLALTCTGPVEEFHIPAQDEPPRLKPLRWADIEREAIEDALRMNGGNRTHTARQLGISLRTLQYRLKEWGPSQ